MDWGDHRKKPYSSPVGKIRHFESKVALSLENIESQLVIIAGILAKYDKMISRAWGEEE